MCVWVKLSDFGVKHIRLLNTPFVKELLSNNILYVLPDDIHKEVMNTDMYNYTMRGIVETKYLAKNVGRVRSIDVNNKMLEIEVNPEYEDYITNMKEPRISFLAYNSLNKTSSVFYIQDIGKTNVEDEEGEAV